MGCVVRIIKRRYAKFCNTLAEPECCDGSDEPTGVCEDVCKEVGSAYRERVRAEHKLRKTVGGLFRFLATQLTLCLGLQDSFILYLVRPEGEETVRRGDCEV